MWWNLMGIARIWPWSPCQTAASWILPSPSPLLLSGVWWTQRMSSATSSPSRYRRRCVTGWPPPSRDRWVWCCDVMRRNLVSEASSMPSRREYLWRGKTKYNVPWRIRNSLHADSYICVSFLKMNLPSIISRKSPTPIVSNFKILAFRDILVQREQQWRLEIWGTHQLHVTYWKRVEFQNFCFVQC